MLVSCVVYQDGKGKIAEIATRQIHEYVSRPNCFVWVALRDPQAPELDEIASRSSTYTRWQWRDGTVRGISVRKIEGVR